MKAAIRALLDAKLGVPKVDLRTKPGPRPKRLTYLEELQRDVEKYSLLRVDKRCK